MYEMTFLHSDIVTVNSVIRLRLLGGLNLKKYDSPCPSKKNKNKGAMSGAALQVIVIIRCFY